MRYPPKYGLTQNWFMYKEGTSLLFLYTRNKQLYPEALFFFEGFLL